MSFDMSKWDEHVDRFYSKQQNSRNINEARNIEEDKYETFHIIWHCNYRFCRQLRAEKVSESWYQATSHLLTHIDDRNVIKQCRECAIPLNTFHEAVIHFAKKHIKKYYKCKICQLWSSSLNKHESHLEDDQLYYCTYCPLHFYSVSAYFRHKLYCVFGPS